MQLNSCNSTPSNLFELHEFSNHRNSSFFPPILLKKARRCIVQAKEEDKFFFMRNIHFVVNSYHKYCTCTKTIINTVYCFGKKSVIEDCLILLKTFWRRGSNFESVVNSVNLQNKQWWLHFAMVVKWVHQEPHPCHCWYFQKFQKIVVGILWLFVDCHISVKINDSISIKVFESQVWSSLEKLIQVEL